jgi:Raf kinase inhibitor-like YbhB/YbcL family protein
MPRYVIITLAVVLSLWVLYLLFFRRSLTDHISQSMPMILTSPSFNDGEMIPQKFTCDGGDINPELQIQNVPAAAKSLALILHDSDAPVAGGFTHWVVWNIDPSTAVIKQESIPPGSVEGRNDAGRTGYVGPCPPSGMHHYHFQFYALDAIIDLPTTAGAEELRAEIGKHLIGETELVGLYAHHPER